MNEQFYIRVGGQVQGPFTVERLGILAQRGRFSRSYEVSQDGMVWLRAANIWHLLPGPAPVKARMPAVSEPPPPASNPDAKQANDDLLEFEVVPVTAEPDWFYGKNLQEYGPVKFPALQQLVRIGQISEHDMVWTDGMLEWVPLSRVPALLAELGGRTDRAPAVIATELPEQGQLQRTAPMAVASLVMALLGLIIGLLGPLAITQRSYVLASLSCVLFLVSVLSVVFGHIALKQIRQSGGILTGAGLGIAGLIAGYFVIIVVTVMAIVLGSIFWLGGHAAPFGVPPVAGS